MPGRAGRNRSRDPFYYWNNTASYTPEAQALATRLGLSFPTDSPYGFKSGLMYPIRRLIITGEDNPTNLSILLGPLWGPEAGELVKKTRIEVLLPPAPGSPNSMLSEQLDLGSPRWTPRTPSKEEEIELNKVKDMQQHLARQLGQGKDVETKDIKETLSSMGGNWVDNLGALETAMNATDQGVGR